MSKIEDRGQVARVLRGHTTADTAHIVQDYPYGRLRCKRRMWVETATKGQYKGQSRLVTQTTNPKLTGEVWNKPHPRQYAGHVVLVEYENGHVDTIEMRLAFWPDEWANFYNTGVWQWLTLPERKHFVASAFVSHHHGPDTWDKFYGELAEIAVAGFPTAEEKQAQNPERRFNVDNYNRMRDYAVNNGPDVRVTRWWIFPNDTVDL